MTKILFNDNRGNAKPKKVDVKLNTTYKNIPKDYWKSRFVKHEEKIENYDRNTYLYVSIYMGKNGCPAIRITDTQVSNVYFPIEAHEIGISSRFYFVYDKFVDVDYDLSLQNMKTGDTLHSAEFIVCKGFRSIRVELRITKHSVWIFNFANKLNK